MQIQKIHIENFGKLHDFDLELQNGMNRISASNGWGKTTLAAFLKAMFYGLDYTTKRSLKENERKKYTPWQGGNFGGSMEFSVEEKHYLVERFFGTKDKEDTFCLYDLSTGLECRDYTERLGEELFRVDRAAFERSSFFVQQDFAASLNDSMNARLTHVEEDAGDMKNYETAAASLEDRMKYFQKTGNRGQLGIWEQSRQQVQTELGECREKERAIGGWKEQLSQSGQTVQKLESQEELLEAQLAKAQEYETKAERRSTYRELARQVTEQENELQRLVGELKGFDGRPLEEEILDSCHKDIYQLMNLREQQKKTESERRRAENAFLQAKDEAKALHPGNSNGLMLALMIGALAVACVFVFLLKWYVPGVAILVAGYAGALYLLKKNREAGRIFMQKEDQATQAEKEYRKLQGIWNDQKGALEQLEEEIRRTLQADSDVPVEELENCWRSERQKSRQFENLKRKCRDQEQILNKSRDIWQAYAARFTDEERQELQTLQRPERMPDELQQELRNIREQREKLQKNMIGMQQQIQKLNEYAERIPELEEESDRLAQEISEGKTEYDLLGKTLKYLQKAREQFSTRYLKNLQQGLQQYLTELNPASEQMAAPALDVKLKVKIREAGAVRDLEYFSAGCQDLIQIAERLAIVDALYEEEQPVLILDDPFVNLDSEKKQRAIDLLERMAQKRQMIYFTCS